MNRIFKLALASVFVGLAVLGLKYLAWRVTGSIALYSDALESIVNVVAAIAALVSVHISAKPADAKHPFGHAKAEYFAAVLEGVLIVIAAISIMNEAWHGLMNPRPLNAPIPGLLLNGVATVLNGAWAAVLIRYGRRWRSTALMADGKHLLTDVVTSVGVVVGVALVALTGIQMLDSLVAALVAVLIIWSGWGLIRESVDGLMDAAPAPEVVAQIREIIAQSSTGASGMHALKTRHAGHTTFIEFDLRVDGLMSVNESHALCDRIEHALGEAIEGASVSIHVEPDTLDGAMPGGASEHKERVT